ncbi:uncharacterized protein PV07_04780 [Cladophialophora immunda]|uniref:C3H1-type domain-containing protein n=1 Tax=Cladophialophora immunda TaxID=569365 RepID=A0A0D2CCW8_9EURO|nr:uncharacterized protein PV07_04780 [Cladophialophora immunda]KIW28928.1 hypothetical protein PV07_04780 [Cladophialophora immunda]OQV08821.1 hypothetical protein CLAIMM_13038 [Cladophialophora immunda]
MSGPQVQLQGLKAEWDLCKSHDDKKHSLIMSLFDHIEQQSKKLSDAEAELHDKKDVIKMTRDKVKGVEEQIQALQLEKARLVFASVVIDGDCMPFEDELVKQGMNGGKNTASLLKQAVEEELRSSPTSTPHQVQVIVRVYANVKGLAKTYKEKEILAESTSLDEFIRGFNMGDAMCDFVDAGNGKECSDEKVKATFRRDLADVHCERVFFGGTADNGYARLLGPFAQHETDRRRILLLEGPPFAQELADIKDRFRTVAFDKVFRSQKLGNVKRRVSSHPTPPDTPSADYAMVVARAPPAVTPNFAAAATTQQQRLPVAGVPVTSGVLRNKMGHRVDAPLSYSQQDFARLSARKLCNWFHLRGSCPYLEKYGNCQHEHGRRLPEEQWPALRANARRTPCSFGLSCNVADCLYGHRCPHGDNCARGAQCKFPPDMHDVDVKIV